MHYASLLVCFEAGPFDNIIKFAGAVYFFKDKLRISLIARYQFNRSYAYHTIQQIPAKLQVNYPEHIQIIYLSDEDSSAPLNAVRRNFVIYTF